MPCADFDRCLAKSVTGEPSVMRAGDLAFAVGDSGNERGPGLDRSLGRLFNNQLIKIISYSYNAKQS